MEGGRDPFFGSGNPFGSSGGFNSGNPFGSSGGFGGFGGQRSLISSFFGGSDPFDDPFFTRPFGGMFETSLLGSAGGPFMNPQASGLLGHQPPLPSLFGSAGGPFMNPLASGFLGHQFPQPSLFRSAGGPFMDAQASRFLEHQPPRPNTSRGPIIEELSSDDGPIIEGLSSDDEKDETDHGKEKEKRDNSRKHSRSSKEPFVEHPDDEVAEKRIKHMPRRNEISQTQHARHQPESRSFTFQSSTVSYGGANGTYYTSSRTRRAGSDGLTFEECKEADTSTGQATHRVARGIHDKGHSVTRNLKSDGHVDTMQTLHNINEDELVGFEEAWTGKARKHLTDLPEGFVNQDLIGAGSSSQQRTNRGGGWALPSTEGPNIQGNLKPETGDRAGPPPRHSGSSRFGST